MGLIDMLATIRHNVGSTLVVIVQVAFTYAVLTTTFAMVTTYSAQANKSTGIRDENTVLAVTARAYSRLISDGTLPGDHRNRIEQDLNLLRTTPGVIDVAMAQEGVPMQNSMFSNPVANVRRHGENVTEGVPVSRYAADAGTVNLLGLTIEEGRAFSDSEVRWHARPTVEGGPNVLVTRALADDLYPDGDAVGKQIESGDGAVFTIIGIMRTLSAVFQAPWDEHSMLVPGRAHFNEAYLVRTDSADTGPIATAIVERLRAADNDREVIVETVHELKATRLSFYLIVNAIVGTVAVLLLIVAAVGNYGHTAYTLLKRTKQIGIRRALGASRAGLLRYLLLENALVTALGIIPGLLLLVPLNYAIVAGFGYGQAGPFHVLACLGFLVAVGLGAALVPVLRALMISPAVATRTV